MKNETPMNELFKKFGHLLPDIKKEYLQKENDYKIDVIKSLPDSEQIRIKARELDEKDFDQWWWETVYKGNFL